MPYIVPSSPAKPVSYQFPNSQVLWNQTDIHIWNILSHHQNNFLHFCTVHCHMVELEEENKNC